MQSSVILYNVLNRLHAYSMLAIGLFPPYLLTKEPLGGGGIRELELFFDRSDEAYQ